MVDARMRLDLMAVVAFIDHGTLPYEGGLMDQPWAFIEAVQVYSAEQAAAKRERELADAALEEAIKKGRTARGQRGRAGVNT